MTQPSIEGVGHGVPRMLYASDGSDWYAILVDSDGHVKIDMVAYPGSNALGNFPFGYNAIYREAVNDIATSNGTVNKDLATVPAGEIWIIQNASANNVTRAVSIAFAVYDGSANYYMDEHLQPLADRWVSFLGTVPMMAGENFRFTFKNLITGDDIRFRARGYKMKIA